MRDTSRPCVLSGITAVIFGVDGVIVDSAEASASAWKTVLDPFLRSHAASCEIHCRAFDSGADYRRHMYGRTRIDGLRHFLSTCDIELTYDDLRGLAGHQEEVFVAELGRLGVGPYPSSVTVLHELRRHGFRTAAVSAHRYTAELLRRAGVAGLFDIRLDGLDAPGTGLPDQADPGLYREAARRLRAEPAVTAVVEENLSAITAGQRGGFGLLIGVDRSGRLDPAGRHGAALRERGAHVVIADLADLRLHEPAI